MILSTNHTNYRRVIARDLMPIILAILLPMLASPNFSTLKKKLRSDSRVSVEQQSTVQGIVLDAKSNEPLTGVTIRVAGKDKTTSTNEEGYFTVEADEGDILEVSYVGFIKNTTTIVNVDTQLEIL